MQTIFVKVATFINAARVVQRSHLRLFCAHEWAGCNAIVLALHASALISHGGT
jgi:hypothetical protein